MGNSCGRNGSCADCTMDCLSYVEIVGKKWYGWFLNSEERRVSMFRLIEKFGPLFMALLIVGAIVCCSYAIIELINLPEVSDCNVIE